MVCTSGGVRVQWAHRVELSRFRGSRERIVYLFPIGLGHANRSASPPMGYS